MRRRTAGAVMVLVLGASVAGCGGGDNGDKQATPSRTGDTRLPNRPATPQEAAQIRSVFAQFQRALAAKDYRAVCALQDPDARSSETDSGQTCEQAVQQDLAGEGAPRLTVGSLEVGGYTNDIVGGGKVTSSAPERPPFKVDATLSLEGSTWRISDPVSDYLSPPEPEGGTGGGEDEEGGE